jgi:GNAT superfamily N-acetyltransferase
MTELITRKAKLSDVARLAELSETLGYPVEPEAMRRRLERLSAKPDHVILVAEISAHLVVGWIHAAEHDILEVGNFCEILGLVVAADQRGAGIGKRLLEQVEQWALGRGLGRSPSEVISPARNPIPFTSGWGSSGSRLSTPIASGCYE